VTNSAALVVGFFTLLVLLVPLGLSPWVPFGLCVVGTALSGGDALFNQGRFARLILDLAQEWLDPSYKKRLAYHESGHLLVGHCFGLKASSYAIGAQASRRLGFAVSSLVEFDQPERFSPRAYGTTLMAGGVAEVLFFEEARGGADDLVKIRALLALNPQREQLEREYCREATRLLKAHHTLHDQLARLMLTNAPLTTCQTLLAVLK